MNADGGQYGNALQAASHGDHNNIIELLLGKGATVNAQGGEYGNALQAASYEGRELQGYTPDVPCMRVISILLNCCLRMEQM